MLENLKIKLIKIAQDAEKNNLGLEKCGSFSIKDKTSGYIVITPAKIKIENLKTTNICIVDLKGEKIETLDGINPSSDLKMHLEVYSARKDIRTFMHINSTYATTFSIANKVIPPISYDSASYGWYIYLAKYEERKSDECITDLIEKLSRSDACLLESNGAIVISSSTEDILSKVIDVEKVAKVYYKALILNQFKEPKRISRDELMLYLSNR